MYYNYSNQLQLPGIRNIKYDYISAKTAMPGQKVVYVGMINGGPGYGSVGSLIEIRGKKAIVEIKPFSGIEPKIWHIPYYLLGSIKNAA